jgi:DNA-binding transcriptional MerR regulator/effector-binding domain-containing protein
MSDEAGRARGLYSIGSFSRVTGLTVKTVRLYHEKGLLTPALVDAASGYRYFSERDVERARLIVALRRLEFPLAELKELLDEQDDAGGTLPFLEQQRRRIEERRARLGLAGRELDRLIAREREALERARAKEHAVEDNCLEPLWVASLRWRGSYDESGRVIGRVMRGFGRHAAGPPLNLYYDLDFREGDADIASCLPIRTERPAVPPFEVQRLQATRALCLRHRGPYDEIHRSYARVLALATERGIEPLAPFREIYLKGPGLILRGNPRDYLTEIQIPYASV